MKVLVRTKGIDLTDALERYVESKAEGFVHKYFTDDSNVDVQSRLKIENEKHIAEVTIHFHTYVLRGESSTLDMYASIDEAFQKIETQYRKHKERLGRKSSKVQGLKEIVYQESSAEGAETPIEVIRRKSFTMKPMMEEEAILQMDLLGHNFFVYLDEGTNNVHVVYKRKEGQYGIIEAER